MVDFHEVEGRKICVVFCKAENDGQVKEEVVEEESSKVQIRTMHGRGVLVENRFLKCVTPEGAEFAIPMSAHKNIYPSDGTEILKDSEYFVIVKVSGMDLD